MKSLAEKKPFHVVSLILVVFFRLMYCSSRMLHPVCIEVNDNMLPKAAGVGLRPFHFTKELCKHSSHPSKAETPLQLTGGHTSAESLWGWRDLWS